MTSRRVLQACQLYQLNKEIRRARGPSGDVLGDASGASVEFQEFRNYVAGDDLRHVDWNAYARTGELTVRLYREEIRPSVEIIVDNSASMQLRDGYKPEVVKDLIDFLLQSALRQGLQTKLWAVGEQPVLIENIQHPADAIQWQGQDGVLFKAPLSIAGRLRPGTLRIILSDFMTTQPVPAVLRTLGANAARTIVLRVLGPWEANPSEQQLHTLRDVEREVEHPVHTDADVVARYQGRMQQIDQSITTFCARSASSYARIVADGTITDVLRNDLLPLEIVTTA